MLAPLSYAQQLTIAVFPYAPPFVMEATRSGKYTGFSVDIMQKICHVLHANCTFKPYQFDSMFKAVKAGEVDLGIGNITIMPSREKVVLFSLPYLPSKLQFITTFASKINTIEDARNKIIGTQYALSSRSPATELLEQEFGNEVKIRQFKDFNTMIKALVDKKIDIVLMDQAIADFWFTNNVGEFKLIGSPKTLGLGYGIVAAKTSANLINNINQAIITIQNDGNYTQIYNTYFADFLPPPPENVKSPYLRPLKNGDFTI